MLRPLTSRPRVITVSLIRSLSSVRDAPSHVSSLQGPWLAGGWSRVYSSSMISWAFPIIIHLSEHLLIYLQSAYLPTICLSNIPTLYDLLKIGDFNSKNRLKSKWEVDTNCHHHTWAWSRLSLRWPSPSYWGMCLALILLPFWFIFIAPGKKTIPNSVFTVAKIFVHKYLKEVCVSTLSLNFSVLSRTASRK